MKRGIFGIAACAALESFALFATVTVDLAEEVGRIKPTVRIGSREGRPILVYNEDNSHYFIRFASGGTVTEEGLRDYVRRIVSGGAVTHFFMCPNAMCANFDSKVMTTTWDAVRRPGRRIQPWQNGVVRMHESGLDAYAVWADECRRHGVSPWLSIRMNDVHCVDDLGDAMHSEFWLAHPEFRRVPGAHGKPWEDAALDFSHREVRDYTVAFIAEALARYDVDGVELDWMRCSEHLTPGKEASLSGCLDEVMRRVRAEADAAAKRLGHPVRVAARVISRPDGARRRGTDFVRWAREGWADWIIPCNKWYSTDFNLPYAAWASLVRDANPKALVVPGTDNGFRKTTYRVPLSMAEYSLFADRMYREGAPGIYLFNAFDHKPESGVWQTLVTEGLPPDRVAEKAKGVTVPDYTDSVEW